MAIEANTAASRGSVSWYQQVNLPPLDVPHDVYAWRRGYGLTDDHPLFRAIDRSNLVHGFRAAQSIA